MIRANCDAEIHVFAAKFLRPELSSTNSCKTDCVTILVHSKARTLHAWYARYCFTNTHSSFCWPDLRKCGGGAVQGGAGKTCEFGGIFTVGASLNYVHMVAGWEGAFQVIYILQKNSCSWWVASNFMHLRDRNRNAICINKSFKTEISLTF